MTSPSVAVSHAVSVTHAMMVDDNQSTMYVMSTIFTLPIVIVKEKSLTTLITKMYDANRNYGDQLSK